MKIQLHHIAALTFATANVVRAAKYALAGVADFSLTTTTTTTTGLLG